jgi:DNA-binding Lrp family transcriptional regulator
MKPLFMQIKCELGQTFNVANRLMDDIPEISELYSTSGSFDLLAKFYLPEDMRVGDFVNNKVHQIPGIKDTYTIISFRLFGGSDIEDLDESKKLSGAK